MRIRREGIEKILEDLGRWAEEGEEREVRTLIGEDFNVRTDCEV